MASFAMESNTGQQPSDKMGMSGRKKCAVCGTMSVAFGAAAMIGFFVVGPAIKHAMIGSLEANPSQGQIMAKAFAHAPMGPRLQPSTQSLDPVAIAPQQPSAFMPAVARQSPVDRKQVRMSVERDLVEWFKKNPDTMLVLPATDDGILVPKDAMEAIEAGPGHLPKKSRSGDVTMSAAADEFVPDMQRRTIMNLLLLGGAAVPVGWLGGGFVYFFIPPGGAGAGAGLVAKDALGDDVTFEKWLSTHQPGDRQLVQGLKGDATYLIVTANKEIEKYALNAVCTHLGCVVPWNRAANKFMCPCHGSQYDQTGKVVRGPAPLSLALAHVNDADGKVSLTPWTETDFRTNTPPWWKP